ncbi:MAG: hypothetical protein HN915_09640 [Candidatus Marinimicrobia bacterium]|nr:hypothetical protein [Nitrosomonadales bacterium]MBT6637055.1 hypothetical protein [Candidatus Neomarinimicrobiota bacterium]MBT7195647.1 hypothetical protein [Candidatus Neomarinimicrobiota bacterium]
MDYHLNRKIKLSEEPEYKNLYSWSLQELNEDGEKIGSDQVPWGWSLYFTASELRYIKSIEIEKEPDDEEDEISSEEKDGESIYVFLHPGICRDGRWLEDDTSYSMLGTDRKIKQFGLRISKAAKDNDEKCHIWGCVSYTAEIDFRDETVDDTVEIYLNLIPKQFDQIAEQLKFRQIDTFQVRLGGVSGFYSEWSPSISTRNIKILAASDDQEVQTPEGCKIEPPRLGNVREFSLTVTERHKLDPKQDLRPIDIDKVFEDAEDYEEDFAEEYQEPEVDKSELLLVQLAKNEAVFARLSTPVWLIFFILCILLLTVLF